MNRKHVCLVLLLAGICAVCAVLAMAGAGKTVFCPGREGIPAVRIIRSTFEETIQPWYSETDDTYYYFLPSALCSGSILNDEPMDMEIDGGPVRKFAWEDGRAYRMSCGGDTVNVKFAASSELPVIFVRMDPEPLHRLVNDSTYTAAGTIRVYETGGYLSCNGPMTMRGRGNSTYSLFEKKPFNLKLERPASLLGMGEDKDWCLLANAWDYSYMNNKLALDMASAAGFRYTPGAEYADVYFNGEYQGVYLVAEKIEVDEDKVNILDLGEKNQAYNGGMDLSLAEPFDDGDRRGVRLDRIPADVTGGYLIERDYRLAADYQWRDWTPSYFETDGYGTAFGIKSPKYADARQVEYIRGLMSEAEQAICSPEGVSDSGRSYLDYIDLTSFVRCYMIAEIACDLDKDVTNTYYYKNADNIDSRIYTGPVWDYDNRFGGTEKYASPEVLTKLASGGPQFAGGWDKYLCEKPEFREAVSREWAAFFRKYLRDDAPARIAGWENQIRKSVAADLIRWPRGEGYPVEWPLGGTFTDDYSFAEEAEYLRSWIGKRCEFLEEAWGR